MHVFIIVRGVVYEAEGQTPEECLGKVQGRAIGNHRFTYQPSTGKVFSDHGNGFDPVGVIYERGYDASKIDPALGYATQASLSGGAWTP